MPHQQANPEMHEEAEQTEHCISPSSPPSLSSSLESSGKPSKGTPASRGPTGLVSSSLGSNLGSTITFIFRDFLKRIGEDIEKRQQQSGPRSNPDEAHLLPPQSEAHAGRMTLVLDLDATLIDTLHFQEHSRCEPDFIYEDTEGCRAKIFRRPYVQEFLLAVSSVFEVVLFTAAGQRHADAVLSHLDPDRSLIHYRLYGHHTVPSPRWNWVKDLSRLGRDLSQTLIVDDCDCAALFHKENWVSIKPFSHYAPNWRSDTALMEILHFLQSKVLPAKDVRQALSEHFNQIARQPFEDMPTPLVPQRSSELPCPAGKQACVMPLVPAFVSMDKETPFAKCHELDITGTSPEAPDEGSSSDSSAELLHMVRLLPSPEKLVNVADDEEKEMSGLKSIARVTRMRSLLKISTEEQVPFILGALSAPDFLTTSDNSNESAIGEKAVLDWEHQCTVSRE